MKVVGAMFKEKLIEMLTSKKNNDLVKINWFAKTIARVTQKDLVRREKLIKDNLNTRIDEDGIEVPAFDYDHAFHYYFKDKKNKEPEMPQTAENQFKYHVSVPAPPLRTPRATELPKFFP